MLGKKFIKWNSFQITTPEDTGELFCFAQPNIVIWYIMKYLTDKHTKKQFLSIAGIKCYKYN